jgi:hypothetical protein
LKPEANNSKAQNAQEISLKLLNIDMMQNYTSNILLRYKIIEWSIQTAEVVDYCYAATEQKSVRHQNIYLKNPKQW